MNDCTSDEFQPVNMVEQQLVAAAHGNQDQQRAFERFIMDETLYVITPEAQPEGVAILPQGSKLELLTVRLEDDRLATAVFTAPQRAAETFGEVNNIAVRGRDLIEMIRHNPAVLNPGHSYSVVWEPESLSRMVGLPLERVVERETQVMLGIPADPPEQLIKNLASTFAKLPEVDAAWLALAAWPDAQEQSWYLDVRADEVDRERIRRALSRSIEGVDLKGRYIDMVITPARGSKGIGICIKEEKKRGLLNRLFG